jgi:hypothetical protein
VPRRKSAGVEYTSKPHWTNVHFKNLAVLASIIAELKNGVGYAMDGDTRGVMLGLVVIILACTALLVGTYATELVGSLPAR